MTIRKRFAIIIILRSHPKILIKIVTQVDDSLSIEKLREDARFSFVDEIPESKPALYASKFSSTIDIIDDVLFNSI